MAGGVTADWERSHGTGAGLGSRVERWGKLGPPFSAGKQLEKALATLQELMGNFWDWKEGWTSPSQEIRHKIPFPRAAWSA